MRVYLPGTVPLLRSALSGGAVPPGPAFAVTPALREWYVGGDLEELEYAALSAAAQASLRLVAADPTAPPRRVVLAADVADRGVHPRPDRARAAVDLLDPVPLRDVAAGHVDGADAAQTVRAAVAALGPADRGDADAAFAVDEAAGHELLWYATQELAEVVAALLP